MELRNTDIDQQPKRLADIVYDRLCEAVVDGTLAPGQRVRDGDLAEQLGVSRMPVREALQRLERQGLIQMVASRFTRVTDVTPEMPGQSIEFIGYLFGIGLRFAVPRLDEGDRAKAAKLARKIGTEAVRDPEAAYAATMAFGTFLAEHSHNPLFSSTLADAGLQLTRNLRGTFPLVKDPAELKADFDALADAIERDDAAAAEEHMRQSLLLGPGQPGPAGAVAHLWDDKK